MEKLKMHTPDLTQDHIARIRELFPNCVTEARDESGKLKLAVDFDQLKQELSDSIVEGPQERYHLNWPGKREALLTANAPIAKTLRPAREESVDFDTTKNLFIEGDNLEALKLLQETYLGKVKMIYIDPPYNTGNDFVYDDDFSEDAHEFLLRSNQKDHLGNQLVANKESNGRFHSDWISMLYSRLKLSRNLLSDDGLIFVSIDEGEVSNLRKIMDEVFGEKNFITFFVWKNKHGGGGDSPYVVKENEYILFYAKNLLLLPPLFSKPHDDYEKMFRFSDDRGKYYLERLDKKGIDANRPNLMYPIECPDGVIKDISPAIWRLSKEELENRKKKNLVEFRKDKNEEWQIYTKTYLFDEDGNARRVKARSILNQDIVGFTQNGNKEIEEILGKGIFQNPKPVNLLNFLIDLACFDYNDAIVMDFFCGSGTTPHAVMQLNARDGSNRKFVVVQINEKTEESSQAYKMSYKTIAEISKERIRRAGKKVIDGQCHDDWNKDIGFRVLKIDVSNMAEVYYTPDGVRQDDLLAAVDNIRPERSAEDLLFQVLLDWGVDLTLPIAKKTVQGKTVFFVDGNALVACFDTGITEELVKELAADRPLRVVFRDNGFASDSVKINAEQIFKQMSPGTDMKSI